MKQGWTYKKLGEFCSFINDGDWIESKDQSESGIRLIQTGNIGNGIYKDKEERSKFISEDTFSSLGCTEIFEGDCLVSRLPEPIGRCCLLPKLENRCITAVDCSILRFTEKMLPKYFVYYSQSSPYAIDITNKTTGTTRKRISRKNLERIVIPLPPLPVQQSIVAELDEINHLLSLKRKELETYDKLAQSLFYEMFGDPVTNEKGWEVKKLGDICEIGTGSTPSRNNKDYYEGSIPWVKSTEVCNCIIDSTEEHISEIAITETNCTLYPKGSILMAMYGQGKTRGQIAILNIEATTNQAVAAILPSDKCNKLFMFQYLHLMYENIRSMARGGNQANLNLSLVKSILIPLPPLPLQQQFAQRIEAIEAQKAQVKAAIEKLETLLAARMQYWFE